MDKLTTLQWKLYNFIKENGKVSVEEIVAAFPEDYKLNQTPTTHDRCIKLRNDIQKLNESVEIEKIIINDRNYNYWLACNEDETTKWIRKNYKTPAMRKLRKYWYIMGKVKKNGQCKLLSTRGDIIDEKSKARTYVETYAESERN